MNKSDILLKLNEMQVEMDKLKGLVKNIEKIEKTRSPFARVEDGDTYYFTDAHMELVGMEERHWKFDDKRYEIGNYFNNEEYAQQVTNQFKVHLMMLKFSEENGMSEIDWNDSSINKYRIELDMSNLEFGIEHNFVYNNINCVYFSSYKVAQDFIDKHGNDVLELLGCSK